MNLVIVFWNGMKNIDTPLIKKKECPYYAAISLCSYLNIYEIILCLFLFRSRDTMFIPT
jgi:hypothetical protein